MQHAREARITSPVTTLKDSYVRMIPLCFLVGVIGIGVAIAIRLGNMAVFFNSYLTSFCFVLTICLGCLFIVTVLHLTRAGWGVTIRRIAELYAACLFPLLILFLPILIPLVLFGSTAVYEWNQPGWTLHDASEVAAVQKAYSTQGVEALPPLEKLKAAYLNRGFFAIRTVLYFVVWGLMSWFFLSTSLKQDQTGDKNLSAKMRKWSAPLMIVFAATLTFVSFDYEMSLSPLWFSTMFPVYIFAGATLSALAAITLTGLLLQRSGRVTDEITIEHYHDLAKLMFSFVFFWGYIAFSQFLLIWYANIPEETFWFAWRINSVEGGEVGWTGWQWMSMVLLFGHILIPFLGLMARTVRRNKTFLLFASIYILVIHWIDHYWIIMPAMGHDGFFSYSTENAPFTFTGMGLVSDLACAVGVIGLFLTIFFLVARDKPLVPLKDPRLSEALNYHNA